jgi:DNA-binding response OmpR family regulator
MRALIVEDERELAAALKEALQTEQFEVIVEYNGDDAVRRLEIDVRCDSPGSDASGL